MDKNKKGKAILASFHFSVITAILFVTGFSPISKAMTRIGKAKKLYTSKE